MTSQTSIQFRKCFQIRVLTQFSSLRVLLHAELLILVSDFVLGNV